MAITLKLFLKCFVMLLGWVQGKTVVTWVQFGHVCLSIRCVCVCVFLAVPKELNRSKVTVGQHTLCVVLWSQSSDPLDESAVCTQWAQA